MLQVKPPIPQGILDEYRNRKDCSAKQRDQMLKIGDIKMQTWFDGQLAGLVFSYDLIKFAYQAGLKDRNKNIKTLLEDVYASKFGTKNRVELIQRLEALLNKNI